MLIHRRVTPSIKFAGTHLYTWVERGTVRVSVLPKNTTQCPRPGLEPGQLDPETSALTMRPPRLPQSVHAKATLPPCKQALTDQPSCNCFFSITAKFKTPQKYASHIKSGYRRPVLLENKKQDFFIMIKIMKIIKASL